MKLSLGAKQLNTCDGEICICKEFVSVENGHVSVN